MPHATRCAKRKVDGDHAGGNLTMREIKAVVFDLDGTLVDSAPDLRTAVNRLLAEEGRGPLDLDAVIGMIGDGATKLVERALAASGGVSGNIDVLTRRFLAHYEGQATERTAPYPGVPETLARLAARGIMLGICTNKPEAPTREVLRDLHLASWFSAVIGGDSLDGVRKPDGRPLLAVLERLQVTADAAVMVGDNANDVGTARAAGIPVIVRAGGYTYVPTAELGADAMFGHFAELPPLLDRWAQSKR